MGARRHGETRAAAARDEPCERQGRAGAAACFPARPLLSRTAATLHRSHPAAGRTVTGGSKKTFMVSDRPRHSSVRKSVLADSSSTPARSLGASRWLVAYSSGLRSAPLRCRPVGVGDGAAAARLCGRRREGGGASRRWEGCAGRRGATDRAPGKPPVRGHAWEQGPRRWGVVAAAGVCAGGAATSPAAPDWGPIHDRHAGLPVRAPRRPCRSPSKRPTPWCVPSGCRRSGMPTPCATALLCSRRERPAADASSSPPASWGARRAATCLSIAPDRWWAGPGGRVLGLPGSLPAQWQPRQQVAQGLFHFRLARRASIPTQRWASQLQMSGRGPPLSPPAAARRPAAPAATSQPPRSCAGRSAGLWSTSGSGGGGRWRAAPPGRRQRWQRHRRRRQPSCKLLRASCWGWRCSRAAAATP